MEERKAQIAEDDIELMDYLRVIWKYKIWIVAITFLSSILAFGWSMLLPKVYEVTTVFEPGRYGSSAFTGEKTESTGGHAIYYLDAPQNLKAKINQGSYDTKIIEKLNLPGNRIGWRVSLERDAHAVKVSLESAKPAKGVNILKEFISILTQEYSETLDPFKNIYVQLISQKQEQISKTEKEIQRLKERRDINLAKMNEEIKRLKQFLDVHLAKMDEEIRTNLKEIDILKARQTELIKEEASVQENTRILLEERGNVMKKASHANPFGLLLYTNVLQQNIAYAGQLLDECKAICEAIEKKQSTIAQARLDQKNEKEQTQIQIEKLKLEQKNVKEETLVRIAKLRSDIQMAQAEIGKGELRKNFMTNIHIIQEPTISPLPVNPKKGLNTAIAGVLGLFISLFGAFFVNYLRTYEKEKR